MAAGAFAGIAVSSNDPDTVLENVANLLPNRNILSCILLMLLRSVTSYVVVQHKRAKS